MVWLVAENIRQFWWINQQFNFPDNNVMGLSHAVQYIALLKLKMTLAAAYTKMSNLKVH